MSTSSPAQPSTAPTTSNTFPTRPYISRSQKFPFTPEDFRRADESEDEDFYSQPRFVTHIDDHAIEVLKRYYAAELPQKGRILDLCSSWISHFPVELEERAGRSTTGSKEKEEEEEEEEEGEKLKVIGLGMNKKELDTNPVLSQRLLQNLNTDPQIPAELAPLDATVCVVSVDYLTSPVQVLASIYEKTGLGGWFDLVVSNRCFPTKAVGRWLRVGEQERLNMVGDYLWWSGWRKLEVVELSNGSVGEEETGEEVGGLKGGLMEMMRSFGMGGGRVDPLWVVRGVKTDYEEEEIRRRDA